MSSPDDSMDRFIDKIGEMMDDMLDGGHFQCSAPAAWKPDLNVYEIADGYVACVDVAGMKREDIQVTVDGATVDISGERPPPRIQAADEDIIVHTAEIDAGRFHRRITVPEPVDADAVDAVYRDGILWVLMPRQGRTLCRSEVWNLRSEI